MPFNGSGTFNRIFSAVSDWLAGTAILRANLHDEFDGVATGLSNCVTRDGQSPPTADLPMAGFKHTNISTTSPTVRTQYLPVSAYQDGAIIWCGTAGGTADARTLTPTPSITAYVAGQLFRFINGAADNTGAVTMAISGLPNTAVRKGLAATALAAGDMPNGALIEILYDGSVFRLMTVQPAGIGIVLHRVADAAAARTALAINNIDFGSRDQVIAPHKNLVVQQGSATAVTATADELELRDSSNAIYIATSVNVTSQIGTSGVNGLDTGAEASSTWYYKWVIYNGSVVSGLLSISSTAPTMPSGYTYKALVGAVYNNSSSNFVYFFQRGRIVNSAETSVLSAGTQTSYTAISLSAAIPPIAIGAYGRMASTKSSGTAETNLFVAAEGSSTTATGSVINVRNASGLSSDAAGYWRFLLIVAQQIKYYVSGTNAQGTVLVGGWEYG